MIDIENEIIDLVYKAIKATRGDVTVSSMYSRTVSKFPHVNIYEMDNAANRDTADSGSVENHAVLTYEVNVYSNKVSGAKAECRQIASIVDDALLTLGFNRLSLMPTPNLMDASVYRITGRYSVIADAKNTLYRRT